MFLHIKFALLCIFTKCLIYAAVPPALEVTPQPHPVDNQPNQTNENLILMKFIREQQTKKQQQLQQNPHSDKSDRPHFRHHVVTTTTTTRTVIVGQRNSLSALTTPNSIRQNFTALTPKRSAAVAAASSVNVTEPYAEELVLYMAAKRKCNHHRLRC